MGDDDFNIPYILETIPDSQAGHQLPSQSKKNVWIVDINGGVPITAKCLP